VAPWGEVLADGGTEPGVTFADIDLAEVDRARGRVPSLMHDRPVEGP
jgi:predicted amidohydrolase